MFIMMNLEISIHFIHYSETLTMSVLKSFSIILSVKNLLKIYNILHSEGVSRSGLKRTLTNGFILEWKILLK